MSLVPIRRPRPSPVTLARADLLDALTTIKNAHGITAALMAIDKAKAEFALRHRAEATLAGWIV